MAAPQERGKRMNFFEPFEAPEFMGPHFAGDSWNTWKTALKGASGGDLTDIERELFTRITGRQTVPKNLRELWLIIGRRGGKDVVAAALALILACCRNWRAVLRPGETAVGMVICPDRRQGRVALNYMKGYLESIPLMNELVEQISKESISFTNGIKIEIHTASFRSVRGYTVPFAILDELAFFRDESSANPDTEILTALRPAMATVEGSLLIALSTPYARNGELWKAHEKYFGREVDHALVIKGSTQLFNPTVSDRLIGEAFQEDPVAAASEYGSLDEGIQFRSDVEGFIAREAVQALVIPGRRELAPFAGCQYFAFIDPSGGSSDSFTLAIAHAEGEKNVLDLVRERRPPFSPEAVTKEFADDLKSYGIHEGRSDRYGGQWITEAFEKVGITIRPAEKPKSDIYLDLLPRLNSGRVELLDNPRLIAQLCNLERRTARGGKDSIDHAPSAHDDLINAAAGALTLASTPASSWGFIDLINAEGERPEDRIHTVLENGFWPI
jgi:hypothetical protein